MFRQSVRLCGTDDKDTNENMSKKNPGEDKV